MLDFQKFLRRKYGIPNLLMDQMATLRRLYIMDGYAFLPAKIICLSRRAYRR